MKKCFVVLFAGLSILAAQGMAQATLVNSGVWDNTQYAVYLADGAISWTDADTQASSLGTGWHLVTITSAAEQNFIADILLAGFSGSQQLWAGGFQYLEAVASDVGWDWIAPDSGSWLYENWAEATGTQSADYNEPNDWGGRAENYLALDGRSDLGRNWDWNDTILNYSSVQGYVAEAPVPEPATMLLLGSGLLGVALVGRRKFKK